MIFNIEVQIIPDCSLETYKKLMSVINVWKIKFDVLDSIGNRNIVIEGDVESVNMAFSMANKIERVFSEAGYVVYDGELSSEEPVNKAAIIGIYK